MKLRKIAMTMIALLIIIAHAANGDEPKIDLVRYTEGYTPWNVMIYAHDPLGKLEGIVHYEADPMDNNPGEMNDTTPCLNAVSKLFRTIQPMRIIDDVSRPNEENMRFTIAYTLEHDGMFRTVELGFFDYSDVVKVAVLSSDGTPGDTVFEGFALMEREYSVAFERLYLDRVASLRRLPN